MFCPLQLAGFENIVWECWQLVGCCEVPIETVKARMVKGTIDDPTIPSGTGVVILCLYNNGKARDYGAIGKMLDVP